MQDDSEEGVEETNQSSKSGFLSSASQGIRLTHPSMISRTLSEINILTNTNCLLFVSVLYTFSRMGTICMAANFSDQLMQNSDKKFLSFWMLVPH